MLVVRCGLCAEGQRPRRPRSGGVLAPVQPDARLRRVSAARRDGARAARGCGWTTAARSSTRSRAGGARRSATATRGSRRRCARSRTRSSTSSPPTRPARRWCACANGCSRRRTACRRPRGARPRRRARPGHFGKVFLADNGSTAVEIALKMALQAQAQRGAPRRTRFVALENAYHGETAGTLSVGDLDLYAAPYRALCFSGRAAVGPALPERPRRSALAGRRRRVARDRGGAGRAGGDAGGDRLRAGPAGGRRHAVLQPRSAAPAAGMGRRARRLPDRRRDRRRDGAAGRDAGQPPRRRAGRDLAGGAARLRRVVEGADGGRAAAVGGADDRRDLRRCSTPTTPTGRAFLHSNTFTGNALAVAVALAVLDVFADDDVLGRVAALAPPAARGDAGGRRRPALPSQPARLRDGRRRRHP